MSIRVSFAGETEPTANRGPILFAMGFRPFFLGVGLYGALALAVWVASYAGLLPLTSLWHGHEMVFGFAVAALAGFLTTAVPKWTMRPHLRGLPLAGLFALWLAGRLAVTLDIARWIDLLFLPVLATVILVDLIVARNARNYQVPAILFALAGLNAMFHFGDPSLALRGAIYMIIAMIALIGGRIIPPFTQNALRVTSGKNLPCTTPRWLDIVAVPAVVLVVATELAAPQSIASGVAALAAAIVLAARMAGWRTLATGRLPLVWILHVGYAWIPVGFLLKACADLHAGIAPTAALHALTAGEIGVMILAVGSRVALGHSGRPLEPAPLTVVAYILVIAGAALRVFGAGFETNVAAGVAWSLGYALFAFVYWPILTRPRIDGVPG